RDPTDVNRERSGPDERIGGGEPTGGDDFMAGGGLVDRGGEGLGEGVASGGGGRPGLVGRTGGEVSGEAGRRGEGVGGWPEAGEPGGHGAPGIVLGNEVLAVGLEVADRVAFHLHELADHRGGGQT